MAVVGIDLGTTYSCIAVMRRGEVEIIPNEEGKRTMASCVSFTDRERLIGDSAKQLMSINPGNTVYDTKRIIGRSFNDPELQGDMRHWAFEVVDADGTPEIQVQYRDEMRNFIPEQVSAMILTKLKYSAEAYLGEKVEGAVITVPARFNDAQRRATKDAAAIAKLKVLGMINEPTAAAVAYGLQEQSVGRRKVLVFDLGGGTFDVTVLVIEGTKIDVLATSGNVHLGGQDFNNRILGHLIGEIGRKHDVHVENDDEAMSRLREACENTKRALSEANQSNIVLHGICDGINYTERLTRRFFNQLNLDLFDSTLDTVEAALHDAHLDKDEIDEVVLVGGSTRIPKIQEMLKEFFGEDKICKTINPQEAVAYGAAIKAAMLGHTPPPEFENFTVNDVTPLSLGIETMGKIMSMVVRRNSKIPGCFWGTGYTTTRDNQTIMKMSVYEGERPKPKENHLLGNFDLHGILPAPAGVPKVDICFDIDSDGILTVSAVEKISKNEEGITITNERGRLSEDRIRQIISEAEIFKEEDAEWKKRAVALNDLESFTYDIQRSIRKEAVRNRIHETTLLEIEERCDELMSWISKNRDGNAELPRILRRKEEMESLCHPVFSRLYQSHSASSFSSQN